VRRIGKRFARTGIVLTLLALLAVVMGLSEARSTPIERE
jgi:hypothetical protein